MSLREAAQHEPEHRKWAGAPGGGLAWIIAGRRHLHFRAGFVYQASKPRREGAAKIAEDCPMRAETDKLVQSIRQSLALLRRHL